MGAAASQQRQRLQPAQSWTDEQHAAAPYDLGLLSGPFVAGVALSAYRALAESPVTGGAVNSVSLALNGMPKWLALEFPEAPE
jgi:hypothetical protein